MQMEKNIKIKTAIFPLRAQAGYLQGLDGMRALAILIVLAAHLGFDHIVPGGFGVTVFFFVSGFLITRILLAEQAGGGIRLRHFYIRRFLRLMPAMYVFITLVIICAMTLNVQVTTFQAASAYLYFVNYFDALDVTWGLSERLVPWGHLWSLAVEEHFYLIFPVALAMCAGDSKRQFLLIAAMIAFPSMARYLAFVEFGDTSEYTYQATEMRLESLAWGCLLAMVFDCAGHENCELSTAPSHDALATLTGFWPVVISLLALLFSLGYRDETFRATWRYSLQGAALFVVFINLYLWKSMQWVISILELAFLRFIGRLSYSLYLWHMIPIYWLHKVVGLKEKSFAWTLACIGVSALAALASYYFIERPLFDIRKRFGGKPVENLPRAEH
jgi:peptidoglycan/LPS O-acetylase OafA/YrhL